MKAYVVFSDHPTVAVIMSSQLNSPGYFTAASMSVIINFFGFSRLIFLVISVLIAVVIKKRKFSYQNFFFGVCRDT